MENKNELLEKLGYSKEYLKLLNDDDSNSTFMVESTTNFIESQIVDNKMTTLIIEKTERPINNHFIYNEK